MQNIPGPSFATKLFISMAVIAGFLLTYPTMLSAIPRFEGKIQPTTLKVEIIPTHKKSDTNIITICRGTIEVLVANARGQAPLSYRWTMSGDGEFRNGTAKETEGRRVRYIAPQISGQATITVTVTDASDQIATDQLKIQIVEYGPDECPMPASAALTETPISTPTPTPSPTSTSTEPSCPPVSASTARSRDDDLALAYNVTNVITPVPDELMRLGRGKVNEVAYAPDCKTLAVASSIGVWLYQLDQPTKERLLPYTSEVTSVSWSSDSTQLAAAMADGKIRLWSIADNRAIRTWQAHADFPLNSIRWSPDSSKLASAGCAVVDPGNFTKCQKSEIKLWSATTGERLRTLTDHTADVTSVSWSPDSKRLASAAWDKTVRLWNVDNGQMLYTPLEHPAGVRSVSWSPDGTQLAAGLHNGMVYLWNVKTEPEFRLSLEGHTASVTSVSWSPDGRWVASGSEDHTTRIWDQATGDTRPVIEHVGVVKTVSWSPDGSQLSSGSMDGEVRLSDSTNGQTIQRWWGFTSEMNIVRWSPDGNMLATASESGMVYIWQAVDGKLLHTLQGPKTRMDDVAWSPDSTKLAAASLDGTVRIWKVATKQQVCEQKTSSLAAYVAWSPDGKWLAVGDGDTLVYVLEAANCHVVRTLKGHTGPVGYVSWSPDSKRIASPGTSVEENLIRVWNAMTGEQICALQGHTSSVTTTTWSPDGKRIASAAYDGTGRIWDAATCQSLFVLNGHSRTVQSISWSPVGDLLATSSWDKTIRIWNASDGQERLVLRGHTYFVGGVSWSPDGSQLASSSSDGTVRVWGVPSLACQEVDEIPQSECEALVALYRSTDGPKWINKTNWFVTNTPCSWYGITCTQQSVQRIALTGNHLTGLIPSELGNLSKLTVLALQTNQLTGAIPPSLGNLSNLEQLFLGNNNLTGGIPQQLNNPKLKVLQLASNGELMDTIPSELGGMKALERLDLSNMNLTGPIPQEFKALQNINFLDLSGNKLDGEIPVLLGELKNLQFLDLSQNRFNGHIPDWLQQLTGLKCLRLNNNQLTGNILVSFTQLENLKNKTESNKCDLEAESDWLDLSHNTLNAIDPRVLDFLNQKEPDWVTTQNYNLVGWWKFDECNEGNVAKDSSGLENQGALQGSLTFINDPERNCVLDFKQASQSVALKYAPSLEPITGTIELWVKLDKLPEDTTNLVWKRFFADTAKTFQSGYGLQIKSDGTVIGFIVNSVKNYSGSKDDDQRWRRLESQKIESGKWHHLALRWDEQPRITLFIDGVSVASQSYTSTREIGTTYCFEHGFANSNCSSNVFEIGMPSTGASGYFIGKMDDLRFYARALSDKEVQHDYQIPPTSPINDTPSLTNTISCQSHPTPTTATDYYECGWELQQKNTNSGYPNAEIDQAYRYYEKAIEISPTNASAYFQLGMLDFNFRQDYTRTITHLTQVIQLDAGHVDTHTLTVTYYDRGLSYKNTNLLMEASADFDKALALEPNYLPPKCFRGVVNLQTGQKDKATLDICACIQQTSSIPEVQIAINEAKKAAGENKLCQAGR